MEKPLGVGRFVRVVSNLPNGRFFCGKEVNNMSEFYHLTERSRRAFETFRREREVNKELFDGVVDNATAVSLQRSSMPREAFIEHLGDKNITSVTAVAIRRRDQIKGNTDSNFVGPYGETIMYATYYFTFSGEVCDGLFIENNHFMERQGMLIEKNEQVAHEGAEELRKAFSHLGVRVKDQNGKAIDEEHYRNKKARERLFQERVAALPSAPAGMEYKRFLGQPVLLPETRNDPIAEGIGYTERQLQVARELQFVKNAHPLSLFEGYLAKREKMIRDGYPGIALREDM